MLNQKIQRFMTLSILAIAAIFSLSNKADATEILANGGFEENMVYWNQTNSQQAMFPTLLQVYGFGAGHNFYGGGASSGYNSPYQHPTFPQEGNRSCMMALYTQTLNLNTIRLYQQFVVPATNTLTISWKQKFSQNNGTNTTADDIQLRVYITNSSGTILQTLYLNDLPAGQNEVYPWETQVRNLGTTYAGQVIRLEFRATVPDDNAPNYNITRGSWEIDAVSANALAPTAAAVTLSGKVKDSRGKAMSQVRVRIMDMNGNVQSVLTNKFGYYEFREIEAGQTYAMEAFQKGVRFINNPRIINVVDNIDGEDFTADDPTISR